jgi:hypothetical protein
MPLRTFGWFWFSELPGIVVTVKLAAALFQIFLRQKTTYTDAHPTGA